MRATLSALVIAAGLAGFGMAAQAAPVPVAAPAGVVASPIVQARMMHRERRMMRHRMMRHRMMRHRAMRRRMHRM